MPKVQTKGRPRLERERFPGGKLKPLSVWDREKLDREERRRAEEADKRRREEDASLIARQPHRREDPTDPRRESPLGRFIARNKLRIEIQIGADRFGDLVRRWRSAKNVPCDIHIAGTGSGEGPTDDAVHDLERRIERVRASVITAVMEDFGKSTSGGTDVYDLIRAMVVDNRDMMILYPEQIIVALRTLAVEMGAITGRRQPYG